MNMYGLLAIVLLSACCHAVPAGGGIGNSVSETWSNFLAMLKGKMGQGAQMAIPEPLKCDAEDDVDCGALETVDKLAEGDSSQVVSRFVKTEVCLLAVTNMNLKSKCCNAINQLCFVPLQSLAATGEP